MNRRPAPRAAPSLALLALTAMLLSGFRGNQGQEMEASIGAGIGRLRTLGDNDAYGELGGNLRFKFKHFPYDDLAGWIGVGASYTTYPTGGDFGNRIMTIAVTGGFVRTFGEFGGGIVLFGDTTGFGPMFVLPSLRVRLGPAERIQFDFGMLDEAPYWTGHNFLHFGVIAAIPWDKLWAPRLRGGIRMNPYSIDHFPFEPYLGVEGRFGAHMRVGVDVSVGDGGIGNPPSFAGRVYVGMTVGKGSKAGEKPQPAR